MSSVPQDVPGCKEMPDRISELLDGELDGKSAARVALHLANCPGCARFALELDATIRALHRLPHGWGIRSHPLN